MMVAVHRGPCWAGPFLRRLPEAESAVERPGPGLDGWHVYELAPLDPGMAQRLGEEVRRAGGWSASRPYGGAVALQLAANPRQLGELAEGWRRHPHRAAAGEALRTALLSTPWMAWGPAGHGAAALAEVPNPWAPMADPGADHPRALPPVARGPRTVRFRNRSLRLGERTLIMGVLNVTPDSFSDGGRYNTPERAVRRALAMVAEGADLIDVGAESANLAASKPALEEELARLLPVVERLVREVDVPISIDTYKAPVAEAALAAGAHLINDISGLHADPELAPVCARYGAGIVIMHLQGHPRRLPAQPQYQDVVLDIARHLQEGVQRALRAGIAPERILVDPGIGVAKRTRHNLTILQNLHAFRSLGYPVLLGASRTSVIGNLLETPIHQRLEGTLATTVLGVVHGVDMVRVHDVRANARAARLADAWVRGWEEPADGWPFDAVTGRQRRPLRELGRLRPQSGSGEL